MTGVGGGTGAGGVTGGTGAGGVVLGGGVLGALGEELPGTSGEVVVFVVEPQPIVMNSASREKSGSNFLNLITHRR